MLLTSIVSFGFESNPWAHRDFAEIKYFLLQTVLKYFIDAKIKDTYMCTVLCLTQLEGSLVIYLCFD